MKKFLKVIGIILLIILIIVFIVFKFFLNYPNLKKNPEINKWYRVTSKEMKASDGSGYRAFFKKGSENKVLIYFAGGGVSVNEETARDETFNTREIGIDKMANLTMNMGGIATEMEGNPFKDWTVILFPYATGDFHAGKGDFKYTDKNGKEKILYHHGYTNYTLVMKKVMKLGGIENPDSVIVTGYSAGGFGAALLSDDIFTNYFPNAKSKNVLVDASLLLKDDWHKVATDVWQTPKSISDKLTTNNLTLDCLKSLKEKYGDDIYLLFDSSTRDGDLAKVQNYFDNGKMEVDEKVADKYQEILKNTIPEFQEAGVNLFIWDGLAWYDDPRNLTMHTIIAVPYVYQKFEEQDKSIVEWLEDSVNGKLADYGLDLVNKEYPKTME